jgi:hypothetical protein
MAMLETARGKKTEPKNIDIFLGCNQMTESKKLTVLREKLILNRPVIVDRLLNAAVEQLGSNGLPLFQDAINAVDHVDTGST